MLYEVITGPLAQAQGQPVGGDIADAHYLVTGRARRIHVGVGDDRLGQAVVVGSGGGHAGRAVAIVVGCRRVRT